MEKLEFPTIQDSVPERSLKNGGNVASYFCDPDGRVIELVVGPVQPNRLMNSAKRSLDLYRSINDKPVDLRQEAVAKTLAQLVGDRNLDFFQDAFTKVKNEFPDQISTLEAELLNAIRATYFATCAIQFDREEVEVKKVHTLNTGTGFVNVFPADFTTFGLSRSSDGGRETSAVRQMNHASEQLLFCENMFLTQFPLIPLGDVEKSVFQILVGQNYSVIDASSKKKIEQVKKALQEKKCLVAVMKDRVDNLSRGVELKEFKATTREELMKFSGIKKQLDDYFVFEATSAELFSILSELGKPIKDELQKRSTKQSGIGFALFDSKGNVRKLLPSGAKSISVSIAMRRVAKFSPR